MQLAAASLQLLLLLIIAVVVVVAFGDAPISVIVGAFVAAEVSARCFVIVVVSFFDESLLRMISVLAGLAFDAVAAAAAAVLIGGVNIVIGDVAVATVEIPVAIPEVATALLIGGVNIVVGVGAIAMNEAARSIVEVKVGAASVRRLRLLPVAVALLLLLPRRLIVVAELLRRSPPPGPLVADAAAEAEADEAAVLRIMVVLR